MLDTWIISDTHFGHKNIIKYCGRPINHNSMIMRNWMNTVGEDEPLLHLGDLTVWYGKDQEYWEDMARTLPGNKRMIMGNHDKRKPRAYKKLGYKIIEPFVWEGILFNHYPDYDKIEHYDIHTVVHGHVHNNNHRKVRHIEGIDYYNVSIEVMGYKPVKLGDILG